MRVGDTLYCHSNRSIEKSYTIGNRYTVLNIDIDQQFTVITIGNNRGRRRRYSIEEDSRGLSYKTWFTTIPSITPKQHIRKLVLS